MMSGRELCIDVGTANTRLMISGSRAFSEEPTLAAFDGGKLVATGENARNLQISMGEAPKLRFVAPVERGAVTDISIAATFLRQLMAGSANGSRQILLARRACLTGVEKQALFGVGKMLGAAEPGLVPSLVAGAVGADISLESPGAWLVVDIGAGRSEAGVIAGGRIVSSAWTDAGGNTMTASIVELLRMKHGLLVDASMAELLKRTIGSAVDHPEEAMVARGRAVNTQDPGSVTIGASEIHGVLKKPLSQILDTIRTALFDLPPDMCADLFSTGCLLIGGGAQMRGLQQYIAEGLQLPVRIPAGPATCAVSGLSRLMITKVQKWPVFGRSAA